MGNFLTDWTNIVLSRTVFDATAVVLPFSLPNPSVFLQTHIRLLQPISLPICPSTPLPTDLSTPTHVAYACVRGCVCSSIHLHTYPCSYKISVDPFTHSINAIRSSNLFNHFWSLSTPAIYSPISLVIPILEEFDANINMNKK